MYIETNNKTISFMSSIYKSHPSSSNNTLNYGMVDGEVNSNLRETNYLHLALIASFFEGYVFFFFHPNSVNINNTKSCNV